MSRKLEELALRKQLLVARSTYQRLQLQSELQRLRQRSRWLGAGVKSLFSPPVNSALLGLAAARLGGGRTARLLALAGTALLVGRAVGALRRRRRPESAQPALPPPG